jgi:hypothetical protein
MYDKFGKHFADTRTVFFSVSVMHVIVIGYRLQVNISQLTCSVGQTFTSVFVGFSVHNNFNSKNLANH